MTHRLPGIRRRRKTVQHCLESLERRTLLTDLSGVITSDMTFNDPSDTINIIDDVQLRNGAILTFGPGVTVVQSSSLDEITVSDDGSGAGIVANNVTFNTAVVFEDGATGSISNSTIARPFDIDLDAGSQLTVTGNTFQVPPRVHAEFVPRMPANTFAANTNLEILASTLDVDTTWPTIPNVPQYDLHADVMVEGGATLTVGTGLTLDGLFQTSQLRVAEDGTAAGIVADSIELNVDTIIGDSATGSLINSNIRNTLTIDTGITSPIVVSDNMFLVEPHVHAEFVPRMPANTFSSGMNIAIIDSTIRLNTIWPVIDNISEYRIRGDVNVHSGATLVIPDGVTVQEEFGTVDIRVSGDNSAARILARDAIIAVRMDVRGPGIIEAEWIEFRRELSLFGGSTGNIDRGVFTDDVTLDPDSAVTFSNLNFAGGTLTTIGISPLTIDMTNHWWGTTSRSAIEQKIFHRPDNANRALVDFEPFLTQAPTMPVKPPPGFRIVESDDDTSVTEDETSDSFTVVLTAQPLVDVVFEIVSDDTGEATVTPFELRFTRNNWDQPQTVTVTGVDDPVVDGDQQTNVTVQIRAAESDPGYATVAGQTVAVTTVDNERAGFVITQTDNTTIVGEQGPTDSFSITLTGQPLTDVVLDIVSDNTNEATVVPAQITFTGLDWNQPQMVTVSGVDDMIADGDQLSMTTVSIRELESDTLFRTVPSQTVSVTTLDDDAAFTITQTDGSTIVGEEGTTDTVAIVLDAEPLTDVVLSVTSGDTEEVAVEPALLTFTPMTWNEPQIVTLTGQNDETVDGSQTTNITVSVSDNDSDAAFANVDDQNFNVTTTDDDSATATITVSSGNEPITISEDGAQDSISVVLDAQPVGNVVFAIESSDPEEASVSTATITFDATNWDESQTINVAGVDDTLVDGTQTSSITIRIVPEQTDDAFDGVPEFQINAETADNDTAGIAVTQTGSSTIVGEDESTDTIAVRLAAQPLSDVQLEVVSGDTGEVRIASPILTFTMENWNLDQTATVAGVDDDFVDGTQTNDVSFRVVPATSDAAFAGVEPVVVLAQTTDNDTAGIRLSGVGDTVVSENGSVDTVMVALTARPVSNVVITLASEDDGEVEIGPETLTFTTDNWNRLQPATVSGVDDLAVDGDVVTMITVAVNVGASDASFTNAHNSQLAVTTTDNDMAGYSATESDDSTVVSETGTADTIDIVLTAQPVGTVIFEIGLSTDPDVAVEPSALTFDGSNWNQPQIITVTGLDDTVFDGDEETQLTLSIDGSRSDVSFTNLAETVVVAMTTDDETAPPALDADGNNDANSADGLMILRYLSGFTGEAIVAGRIDSTGTRPSAAAVTTFLDSIRGIALDPNDDGEQDFADGILIKRFLASTRGEPLTTQALTPNSQRTEPDDIATFLTQFLPVEPQPGPTPVSTSSIGEHAAEPESWADQVTRSNLQEIDKLFAELDDAESALGSDIP